MFANHEPVSFEFGRPEVIEVRQKYYDELE